MRIETTETPPEGAHEAIMAVLDAYNDAASGRAEPSRRLAVLVRDAAGTIRGGLWAISYYDWLFIQLLAVPETMRGQGVGSGLLAAAEAEARVRGCLGIWLDTFSFQARPFYERHGYRVFGTLPDYPRGHARHFLCKLLEGESR